MWCSEEQKEQIIPWNRNTRGNIKADEDNDEQRGCLSTYSMSTSVGTKEDEGS